MTFAQNICFLVLGKHFLASFVAQCEAFLLHVCALMMKDTSCHHSNGLDSFDIIKNTGEMCCVLVLFNIR